MWCNARACLRSWQQEYLAPGHLAGVIGKLDTALHELHGLVRLVGATESKAEDMCVGQER